MNVSPIKYGRNVNIRVDEDFHSKVDAISKAKKCSKSVAVRLAVDMLFDDIKGRGK